MWRVQIKEDSDLFRCCKVKAKPLGRGKRRGWISSGRVGGSQAADVTGERGKRQGRKHRQRGFFFYILKRIKTSKTRNIYFDKIQLYNLRFRRAEKYSWEKETGHVSLLAMYQHATSWGRVSDRHTHTQVKIKAKKLALSSEWKASL